MLLIASNLILSQNTSTQNIDDSQIKEIYKGLKQNEYLKLRLQKTDNALTSAQNLINEQEKTISSFKNLANSKDQIISTLEEVRKQELNISRERETQFKSDINILKGDCCCVSQRYLKMKAIHNKKSYSITAMVVVVYPKDT